MKIQTILEALEQDGCSAKAISTSRLDQLREEIQALRNIGALDEKVFNDYLLTMKYQVPSDFPDAKSIIIIAVPQPQLR